MSPLIALLLLARFAPGQGVELPSAPQTARISGVVIDEQDSRPLSHVIVCVGTFCDETGIEGKFVIEGIPPGSHNYSAVRAGYVRGERPVDGLSPVTTFNAGDNLTDIKIRLRRTGAIVGRVVYADG